MDKGSAFERESDVGSCSLMSLETETSLASVVLLGKRVACWNDTVSLKLSRNINIVARPRLDRKKSYSEYSYA